MFVLIEYGPLLINHKWRSVIIENEMYDIVLEIKCIEGLILHDVQHMLDFCWNLICGSLLIQLGYRVILKIIKL